MSLSELSDAQLIQVAKRFIVVFGQAFCYATPDAARRLMELALSQTRILHSLPLDDRGFSGKAVCSPEIKAEVIRLHMEAAEILQQDLARQQPTPEVEGFLADVTAYLKAVRGNSTTREEEK